MDEEEDEEPVTFSRVVERFADRTQIHGVSNILVANTWYRRLFWLFLLIGSTGFCGWQLYGIYKKLYDHPTVTTTSISYTSPMLFPSITICNLNPLRYDRVLELLRTSPADEVDNNLQPLMTLVANISELERDESAQMDGFLFLLNSLDRSALEHFSTNLSDVLVACSFRGTRCGPEDFLPIRNSRFGLCFVFNTPKNALSIQRSVISSGSGEALRLTLHAGQESYIPGLSEQVGYKAIVHDWRAVPIPDQHGFQVSPGLFTTVRLQTRIFERAPPPYGPCANLTFEENRQRNMFLQELPFSKASHEVCMRTCEQERVIEQCGCFNFHLGHANDDAFDRFAPLRVCNVTLTNSTDAQCSRNISSLVQQGKLGCRYHFCAHHECIYTRYNMMASSTLWPAEHALNGFQQIVTSHDNPVVAGLLSNISNQSVLREIVNRNFLKLEFYFEDMELVYEKTMSSYNLLDFICDVGGIAGLGLGFSLLTFMEFVELGADMLLAVMNYYRNGKKQSFEERKGLIDEKVKDWKDVQN